MKKNLGNMTIKILILLFATGVYGFDLIDPVGNRVKDGVKDYRQGNMNGALENFQKAESSIPEDLRLSFNKGAVRYKMGDYKSARTEFEKIASEATDPELKAKSLYNLGNTHIKLGDKKSALRSYLDALSVSPNLESARKNIELLHREEEKNRKKIHLLLRKTRSKKVPPSKKLMMISNKIHPTRTNPKRTKR